MLRARLGVLRRRLRWPHRVALVLLAIVCGVSAYWLRPSTQRELALEKLTPLVDELSLDYVHLTPWSLDMRGLRVRYQGAVYQVGDIDVGFNPFGLIARTLKTRHVGLHGVVLDLRELVPTPDTLDPFVGVLNALNHGYALALDRLDARFVVLLPGSHSFDVVLHGGDLGPLGTGEVAVALRHAGPAGPQSTDVHGKLALTQINRGRVRELSAEFRTAVVTQQAVRPEPLSVQFRIVPERATELDDAPAGEPRVDGTKVALREPESVHLEIAVGENAHAVLKLDGRYTGEDGRFTADYSLSADTRLLAPYAAGSTLPELASESHGRLDVDTVGMRGSVTVDSTTRAAALTALLGEAATLPAAFTLHAVAQGVFDTSAFTLDSLTLDVRDDAADERLRASLAAPVVVPYTAPLTVLDAPRELAAISLGPVPLAWFEGLTPGHTLGGQLQGRYALVVDDEARFKLNPSAPTTVTELKVAAAAAVPAAGQTETDTETVDPVLVDGLTVTLQPTASWSGDYLRYALNEFTVSGSEAPFATLTVKAASKQGQQAPRSWRYRLNGEVDYDGLNTLPVVARQVGAYALPAGLTARFKGVVEQRANAVSIEQAEVDIREPAHPAALQLRGLRPFHLEFGGGAVELTNQTGELASVVTRGFELAWLNPLLPGTTLAGSLSAADFVLTAPTPGTLSLTAAAPLRVERLAVLRAGKSLLRNVNVTVSSYLMYSAKAAAATLSNIVVQSAGRTVLSGNTEFAVGELDTDAPRYLASGKLAIDLAAAAAQPALADALAKPLPDMAIDALTSFAIDVEGDAITARNARAEVRVGDRARIVLEAEPGLQLKTRLGAGEDLAQYFVGAAALDIEHLSSATLGGFLALQNVSFAEINSSLRVRSNGATLRANTVLPLGVDAIRISDGTRDLFREFSIRSDASLRFEQREVRALFEDLVLSFAAQPSRSAVGGHVRVHIEPGRKVPLTLLSAELKADLPQLLEQPAVLPGHGLKGGSVAMTVEVDASRRIAANIALLELAAEAPLAIEAFNLPITGELAADGQGFDFTAPLVGRGKSGPTTAAIVGHYAPQPDEPRVLRLDIASDVFYLNDILATIAAISPQRAQVQDTKKLKIVLNQAPDETAAWKVIPYAVVIDLQIDKLFYSDYLAFTEVGGELDLRRTKLALNDIRARFHDSVIKLNGVTRFKGDQPEPYQLDLTGTVKEFNLSQFFTELVPGRKPRIKGLFTGDVKAFGAFPNFSQLRNNVLFDIVLNSREGLFRPLPPDSSLLLGASDVLGVVGETLSYVPTGAFGAGAVARLVNYIARIDYDTIDIHVRRDERRDIIVEQFLVLSPTVALTATGGVKYESGTDLLDSPLELTGHLDMLGRGAAILYSMDLMQNDQNDFGYWRGPEFNVWGTLAEPQSNFDEIVQRAGDGTLKGAITRPISGLIGNLKYRWFNDDSRARESAQQHRREQREALEAGAASKKDAPATESAPAPQ